MSGLVKHVEIITYYQTMQESDLYVQSEKDFFQSSEANFHYVDAPNHYTLTVPSSTIDKYPVTWTLLLPSIYHLQSIPQF